MTALVRWPRRRRPAPESWPPVVFRWDLDKTYLKSDFDSLRGLVRIPFEKAENKVAVPGVVPLIRGLRRLATERGQDIRILFLSASPPQIARSIKAKLKLDGIEYDGIVFKNQLHHIVRGRFRNLREQVGYKLTELLKSRPQMPTGSREILFGDDWESDPIIYSLYADIAAGRIEAAEIAPVLHTIGVDLRLIDEIGKRTAAVDRAEIVGRIFINLERRTPPRMFSSFGARLVPAFNYFQTAVCLYEMGHLTLPAVAEVATEIIEDAGHTPQRLSNSLANIVRRGHIRPASAASVRATLQPIGLLASRRRAGSRAFWRRLRKRLFSRPDDRRMAALPPSTAIDYAALVANWRAARQERTA